MTPVVEELKKKLREMFPEATDGEIDYAVNQVGNIVRRPDVQEDTGAIMRTDVALHYHRLYVHAPGQELFRIEFGHGKYVFWLGVGKFY